MGQEDDWKVDEKVLSYIEKVLSTEDGMKSIRVLSGGRIGRLEQAMEEIRTGLTPIGRATYNLASSIYSQITN